MKKLYIAMSKQVRVNLSVTVFCMVFCLCFTSCADNTTSVDSEQLSLITLRVLIPDGEDTDIAPPVVRSGTPVDGVGDENKISNLKFFVFNTSGVLEQYKGIAITDAGTSTDPMWDPVNKQIRLLLTAGAKKVYCVANWTDSSDQGMPVLNGTFITDSTTLIRSIRTHANFTLANPPAMSGRAALAAGAQSMNLSLQRQVARVEIYPMISNVLSIAKTKVSIKGVKFRKVAKTSYLFRQYPSPVNPSSFATWDQASFVGSNSANITATIKGSATAYATKYYIPENIATANTAVATYMVINTLYNGVDTYYSIVLNDGAPSPSHPLYAIERNHIYRYYITIQGVGKSTEAASYPDAAQTREASDISNITYELDIK